MGWPTANEFALAIQHPFRHFCRPELKRGQAALDEQGLPNVRTGKHLDVYELRGAGGVDRWAIGCFTKPPKGVARRYRLINDHLQKQPAACLMEQEYIEQGICVRGKWYPVTQSHWIDGVPLNDYVCEYLDHPNELKLLANAWVRAAGEMRSAGIAHGDLQPATVLVRAGHGGALELRLVDYDGIYVPALKEPFSEDVGHTDFQHPLRTNLVYNSNMDRFAQLVVLTALYALAVEGRALWERFDTGQNLLFRQNDFQKPGNSALFGVLWHSESSTVRALAGFLILASIGSIDEVPSLETVAECLRPGAARSALTPGQIDKIKKVMDAGVRLDFDLRIADEPTIAKTDCQDDKTSVPAAVAEIDTREAIMVGRPARPAAMPPPLPCLTAREHPQAQTYQLEAWMPEEIAVVKLHGFVKDAGGQIIDNIPGYIRVHLLNGRDLGKKPPALLTWLGVVEKPPSTPRVLAVMELNLVHKPTPMRKLIGITMRLAPGPEDDTSPRWKGYCDRMFCELRGYLMGAG